MVKLEDLKLSLRLDEDWDDGLLQNYIDTAQDYIMNAVNSGASLEEFNKYKQFDFATSLLAQYWYINRSMDTSNGVPDSVLSMIQQLRGHITNETVS